MYIIVIIRNTKETASSVCLQSNIWNLHSWVHYNKCSMCQSFPCEFHRIQQNVPVKKMISLVNYVQSGEFIVVHLHPRCCQASRCWTGSSGADQEPLSGPQAGGGGAGGSCAWCGRPTSPAAGRTKAPCSSSSCSGGGPCLCYCKVRGKEERSKVNIVRFDYEISSHSTINKN